MKRLLFILFLLHFLLITVQAKNAQEWTRIQSIGQEFSVAVPPNFLVDNTEQKGRIFAYEDGTTINITMDKDRDAKRRLAQNFSYPFETRDKYKGFTSEDFNGYQYISQDDGTFVSIYLASSNGFYLIYASTRDKESLSLKRFINSIWIGNKFLYVQTADAVQKTERTVSIDSIPTSQIITDSLNRKNTKKVEIKYSSSDENPALNDVKYSRPLIVLRQLKASYTDSGRRDGVEGVVRLKINFLANGEIGTIVVLSNFDKTLTKNAIEAAKKIKFIPAEIDSKPVDAVKFVEYGFNIY